MARSTLFVFPSDLVDEGVERVLARVAERGVDGVTLATAYHRARDFAPRRTVGRQVLRRDGVFAPLPARLWDGVRLRPPVQDDEEVAAAARLFALAGQAQAWTVFLHNTTLGTAHPEACARNCFGDRMLADLCPANPDTAGYAVALARTVTAAAGAPIVAESLSYGTYDHGHHHERSFVPLGSGERFLLGLCFCPHCTDAAGAHGVDAERLRAAVKRHLEAAFEEQVAPTPADPEALCEIVGDDLAGMLAARQGIVTELARTVAGAVHADGGRLVYLDLTGALLGYASGVPQGPPAAAQSWLTGVDVAAVAEAVDGYACLAYTQDPARVATDVGSIVDTVAGRCPVRVVLRPGYPDTRDAAHLAEKVAAVTEAVDGIDFYHYGLYPWHVLDRLPSALS